MFQIMFKVLLTAISYTTLKTEIILHWVVLVSGSLCPGRFLIYRYFLRTIYIVWEYLYVVSFSAMGEWWPGSTEEGGHSSFCNPILFRFLITSVLLIYLRKLLFRDILQFESNFVHQTNDLNFMT